MAVHTFELFHGIALTKLVRNERPTTLVLIETNQDEAWAIYTINGEIALLIKHVTTPRPLKRTGNRGRTWQFVFNVNEISHLRELPKQSVHTALVCGAKKLRASEMAVCLLLPTDIHQLLNLESDASQSITVRLEPGKRLRAQSSRGGPLTIARNRLEEWAVPGS